MKIFLVGLFFFLLTNSLHAALCGQLAHNPITGELDCVGVPTGANAFSVSAFSDGFSSPIEYGVGVWRSTGNLTFSASYANGPATSGTISFSGWTSGLVLGNSFQGPTVSTASVNYPASVAGTVVFSLSAAGAAGSAGASITHAFNNDRYWGVSTVASGYVQSDLAALGNIDLTNAVPNTLVVSPGSGQYIVYGYPSRLGTATFTVGGLSGGFVGPETDSITNGSSYTENYYVYHSFNTNLGSTTVTVTTP